MSESLLSHGPLWTSVTASERYLLPLRPLNVRTKLPWASQALAGQSARAGIPSHEHSRQETGPLQTCWCGNSLRRDRCCSCSLEPQGSVKICPLAFWCVCTQPPGNLELWERKYERVDDVASSSKPSSSQMCYPWGWGQVHCWVRCTEPLIGFLSSMSQVTAVSPGNSSRSLAKSKLPFYPVELWTCPRWPQGSPIRS